MHFFPCYKTLSAKHWPDILHLACSWKKRKNISLYSTNRTWDPREEGKTQEVLEACSCGSPKRVSPLEVGPSFSSEHPSILLFPSQVRTDLKVTWINLILGLEQSTPFLQITALSKAGSEKRKEMDLEIKFNMNVRYHRLFSSFISLVLINDSENNCRKLMEQ